MPAAAKDPRKGANEQILLGHFDPEVYWRKRYVSASTCRINFNKTESERTGTQLFNYHSYQLEPQNELDRRI